MLNVDDQETIGHNKTNQFMTNTSDLGGKVQLKTTFPLYQIGCSFKSGTLKTGTLMGKWNEV